MFCYQARKWIGSFTAALGGVDTLVFAAGIGENAPIIRERICNGLGFIGIELNRKRNAKNAPLISPDSGRVKVRVIRTDEELMIARSVIRLLNVGATGKTDRTQTIHRQIRTGYAGNPSLAVGRNQRRQTGVNRQAPEDGFIL
jgi:hypothetical protein